MSKSKESINFGVANAPSPVAHQRSSHIDTSDFKCFKSPKDGSTYYGQVAYLDRSESKNMVSS